jgi:hypothetical protein
MPEGPMAASSVPNYLLHMGIRRLLHLGHIVDPTRRPPSSRKIILLFSRPRNGGLCKTQSEEVKDSDSLEGCGVSAFRSAVVGVHAAPGLEAMPLS